MIFPNLELSSYRVHVILWQTMIILFQDPPITSTIILIEKKVSNVAGNTYYLETAILKNQSPFGSEL